MTSSLGHTFGLTPTIGLKKVFVRGSIINYFSQGLPVYPSLIEPLTSNISLYYANKPIQLNIANIMFYNPIISPLSPATCTNIAHKTQLHIIDSKLNSIFSSAARCTKNSCKSRETSTHIIAAALIYKCMLAKRSYYSVVKL